MLGGSPTQIGRVSYAALVRASNECTYHFGITADGFDHAVEVVRSDRSSRQERSENKVLCWTDYARDSDVSFFFLLERETSRAEVDALIVIVYRLRSSFCITAYPAHPEPTMTRCSLPDSLCFDWCPFRRSWEVVFPLRRVGMIWI